jgi:hypothetical protein
MRRGTVVVGAMLFVVVAAVAVAAIVFTSARASLTTDASALAKVQMPTGGGTIESVSAVAGPRNRPLPVEVRGQEIYPRELVGVGQSVTVDVVVKRPGWIAWLAGATERLRLTLETPVARLREHYLTVRPGDTLSLRFQQPIQTISYGPSASTLQRHVLATPQSQYSLTPTAQAGFMWVAAAPRSWERSNPSVVSWFPAGGTASAVADPAPGTRIKPGTPITLTFSKPVADVLGSSRPLVSPATTGSWQTVSSHTIVFAPTGYGYGLGVSVALTLPSGIRLVGAQTSATGAQGAWTVPAGSTLRLQQLLAELGYLPLRFRSAAAVTPTPQGEQNAAVDPPAGTFSWRYGNVPSALRSFWSAGASGVMTRGAVMAFETDQGLAPDGVAGALVWRALIGAALKGQHSAFGYTFVNVSEASQSLNLWHNGHTVLTTPVNTGIAAAPTATGTYPVFEHISSGTMSGTNPDGSHYSDPGIPWISYFNGGDALHGFVRGSYGSPQSLGCVEMPISTAGQVWPYTPVGTLVHVI